MTTQKTQKNSYDEIKGMLNTLRKFQPSSHGSIREQVEAPAQATVNPNQLNVQGSVGNEKHDLIVINNVEVVVNSADDMDLEITDDEKGKISQLIDDFRAEVSELATLSKLTFYGDDAKLDGQLSNINLGFTLSAGNDSGLYLSNANMLKVTQEVMDTLNKLNKFQYKYTSVINELIMNRKLN